MSIAGNLRKRKYQIEIILSDFGINSTQSIEDVLKEREEIMLTLKYMERYTDIVVLGDCIICNIKATAEFTPYCSVDCQTHDNLL